MDLGGFMEKHGNDTVIGFDNCERYFAKGTHGITGVHRIPVLTDKNNNDFLTRLFVQINENISKDAEIYEKELLDYETVMNDVQQIIDGIISADTANEAVDKMRDVPFVLTAEREAKNMFGAKIKELGLIYNKESKTYREPGKAGA
jgi:transcriptional regulator CtsR